jgi:hypothetical protein
VDDIINSTHSAVKSSWILNSSDEIRQTRELISSNRCT